MTTLDVPDWTGSDSDLTRPAPPKPTRLPTIRIGRDDKRPVVQIRNQALYDDDDGTDYSDYSQVSSPAHPVLYPASQPPFNQSRHVSSLSVRKYYKNPGPISEGVIHQHFI